jgi:hypothetical protein
VDVVFFHGLQLTDSHGAWRKTWVVGGRDDGPCWPRTLLGADFPDARVLSVRYDSAACRSSNQGRVDLTSLGDLLAGALLNVKIGQRPVVLVGHSLGGLMLQQVCMSVDGLANACSDAALKRRASAFIGNVVGAVFYSSPLAGSRLADWADNVSWLAGLGPVMKTLTTLSLEAHRVTGPFGHLRKREQQERPGSWATLGLCETNATSPGKVGGVNQWFRGRAPVVGVGRSVGFCIGLALPAAAKPLRRLTDLASTHQAASMGTVLHLAAARPHTPPGSARRRRGGGGVRLQGHGLQAAGAQLGPLQRLPAPRPRGPALHGAQDLLGGPLASGPGGDSGPCVRADSVL